MTSPSCAAFAASLGALNVLSGPTRSISARTRKAHERRDRKPDQPHAAGSLARTPFDAPAALPTCTSSIRDRPRARCPARAVFVLADKGLEDGAERCGHR